MSVSITGGSVDLDAILGSNEDFQKRLSDMRETKANLDKALSDLALGKDAQAAFEEAKASKITADRERTEEYNKLQREMQRNQHDLAEMTAKSVADSEDRINRAQSALVAAEQKKTDAQASLEAARAVQAAAEEKSAKLLEDAQASADALLSEATKKHEALTSEAERLRDEAQTILNTAASQKSDWEARVAKLKAAIS